MLLTVFIPVIIAIAVFFLVRFLTNRNLLNNKIVVRLRILLGCAYIGYLVSEIMRGASFRFIVLMIALICIMIAGLYQLQKKYFIMRQN